MTTAAQSIRELKAPAFSFELLPPLKGNSISRVYRTIDALKDFKPLFVNITSHRDEVVFRSADGGLYERKVTRKRPGTVAVAASIKHRYGIPVVPHIIWSGFTRSETEYGLIDLNFLGIHDVLLLRGDKAQRDRFYEPAEAGNAYALELIEQVNNLNKGVFLDETLAEAFETPFSFGVAGYPEKHEEAPNLDSDLFWLKKKVDAGAEYVVTQMFFDNSKYFAFVEKCRAAGITVPIVPGLKPITLKNQLTVLPKIFHTDIPEDFAKALRSCKTDEEAARVGVEWTTMQARDLLDNGVKLLHFYTMMATQSVRKVAEQIY